MEIIDKSHKLDYAIMYYIILVLSLLTFRKVNKIEMLKMKLREKKQENSNRNV